MDHKRKKQMEQQNKYFTLNSNKNVHILKPYSLAKFGCFILAEK